MPFRCNHFVLDVIQSAREGKTITEALVRLYNIHDPINRRQAYRFLGIFKCQILVCFPCFSTYLIYHETRSIM